MTVLQQIMDNPNKAYNKFVTTKEIHNEFVKACDKYNLPKTPTTKDFNNQTECALKMLVAKRIIG